MADAASKMNTITSKQPAALRIPFELVEDILLRLDTPDIMIAAANVPRFWREVIERSESLKQRIESYSYLHFCIPKNPLGHGRKRDRFEAFGSKSGHTWTFKHDLDNGTLLVHRRYDGAESFILAPTSLKAPFRVLNPFDKQSKYNCDSGELRNVSYGFMDLYDFEGKLTCSMQVGQFRNSVIRRYVATYYSDKAGCTKTNEGEGIELGWARKLVEKLPKTEVELEWKGELWASGCNFNGNNTEERRPIRSVYTAEPEPEPLGIDGISRALKMSALD